MSNNGNEGVPSRRRFLQQTLAIIPLTAMGGSLVTLSTSAASASSEGVSAQYVPRFLIMMSGCLSWRRSID